MLEILKGDLNGYYCWDNESSHLNLDEYDLLDLTEGPHVLFFLNDFSKRHNLSSPASMLKIEKLLQQDTSLKMRRRELEIFILKEWHRRMQTGRIALDFFK